MQILNKVKVYFWDVDRTLIMWEQGDKWHAHVPHIQLMRQFHFQGHGNVVWSAGGYEWASRAIRLLGIENLVDFVVNKPDGYIDDKRAEEFMPANIHTFLEEEATK